MSACSDDEPLRARRALSPDPIFLLLTKFYNWNRVREDQRYLQCAAGAGSDGGDHLQTTGIGDRICRFCPWHLFSPGKRRWRSMKSSTLSQEIHSLAILDLLLLVRVERVCQLVEPAEKTL